MGRKKIAIKRIADSRRRQVTFSRRKFGLMKKAYELSVLCNCHIGLIMFTPNEKLFLYSSTPMDDLLLKYTDYTECQPPAEALLNKDMERLIEKGKDFFDDEDCLSGDDMGEEETGGQQLHMQQQHHNHHHHQHHHHHLSLNHHNQQQSQHQSGEMVVSI
jgi:hypothetical protein